MTKLRPFLLALASLGLAALVWFDNRDMLISMWEDRGAVAAKAPTPGPASVDRRAEDAVANDSKALPEDGVLRSGNPLASFEKESLKNWVQRPLFAPARKPPPPAEAKQAVEAPKPPPDYQLIGVLLNQKRTIALLRSENSGAQYRVEVGDMIGGWLVASVERDTVVLKRDEDTSQIIQFKKACSKPDGAKCS